MDSLNSNLRAEPFEVDRWATWPETLFRERMVETGQTFMKIPVKLLALLKNQHRDRDIRNAAVCTRSTFWKAKEVGPRNGIS